jgi:hypothetical protein
MELSLKREMVACWLYGLGVTPTAMMNAFAWCKSQSWVYRALNAHAVPFKSTARGTAIRLGVGHGRDCLTLFPLTPEKAWVLELIFGDGSVSRTGYRTVITTGDRDIIEKVNRIFGGCLKISHDKNAFGEAFVIRINSVVVTGELREHFGLSGVKAATMAWPDVPVEVLRDFVRGLLDSDGCWNVPAFSKGHHRMTFHYTSNSQEFVQSLLNVLRDHVGIGQCASVQPQRHAWQLSLGKEAAIKLGMWLYDGKTARIRCARKFDRWNTYVQACRTGQRYLVAS